MSARTTIKQIRDAIACSSSLTKEQKQDMLIELEGIHGNTRWDAKEISQRCYFPSLPGAGFLIGELS